METQHGRNARRDGGWWGREWQRKMGRGKPPSVGTPAFFFFLLLFLLLVAFQVQTAGVEGWVGGGGFEEGERSLLVDRTRLELWLCKVWKVSNSVEKSLEGGVGGAWNDRSKKNPGGQLSAANGVWYLPRSPPFVPVTRWLFFSPSAHLFSKLQLQERKIANYERKYACVKVNLMPLKLMLLS